jgi:hypothetical protein
MNLVLVPFFNMPVWHWPLAWGGLINALWLLVG